MNVVKVPASEVAVGDKVKCGSTFLTVVEVIRREGSSSEYAGTTIVEENSKGMRFTSFWPAGGDAVRIVK